MELKIPSYVLQLMHILETNGYECYVVGGAVRSLLLNLPVHDYDLTTNALPDQMKQVFRNYHTLETGIQHGTITVIIDHHPVEITTYRKDSAYKDHRHPDHVEFTSAIKEDCARRDFTINAFCYNPKTGILDFFHGKEDLENKVIRCIGNPHRRFEEDALRLLRAVRFAAQLNFHIESETSKALLEKTDSLSYVSVERIREEFTGYLKSPGCSSLFSPYHTLFETFLPELKDISDTDTKWLLERWNCSNNDALCRFALLLTLPVFPNPRSIMRRMKFSNKETDAVSDMILHKEDPVDNKIAIKHLLYKLEAPFKDYLHYRSALDLKNYDAVLSLYQSIIENNEACSLKQLAITGTDLVSLDYKGKAISDELHHLLMDVIDEKMPNDHDILLEKAKKDHTLS